MRDLFFQASGTHWRWGAVSLFLLLLLLFLLLLLLLLSVPTLPPTRTCPMCGTLGLFLSPTAATALTNISYTTYLPTTQYTHPPLHLSPAWAWGR